MSLTTAVVLLALVLITGISKRIVKSPPGVFFGGAFPFLVCVMARGPEPTLTYVRIGAVAVALILFVLRLSAATTEVRSRLRAEVVLIVALILTIAVSALWVPDTSSFQRPLLVTIVGLAAALFATAFGRLAILFARSSRQKSSSV
jgi:hypothetical protein